jgi:hypothetical protein
MFNLKAYLHWQSLLPKTLAVSRHDYAIHTYLDHLGQKGTNSNNPICGGLPKVAKVCKAGSFVA